MVIINGKHVVVPAGRPRRKKARARRKAIAFSGHVPERAIWLRVRN